MNTALIEQVFGIASLTSADIELFLITEQTRHDAGSEDANRLLRLPSLYLRYPFGQKSG